MSFDPYAELGVPYDADQDAIKAAHRKKIKKVHPDAGGSPETFDKVQRSYMILSDQQKRDHYDRTGQTETDSVAAQEAQVLHAMLGIMEQVVDNEPVDLEFTDIKQLIVTSVDELLRKIDAEVLATTRKLTRLDKLEKRFKRKKGAKGADASIGMFQMVMKQQRLKLQGHLDMTQKAKDLHERVKAVFNAFDYEFSARTMQTGFSTVRPGSAEEAIMRHLYGSFTS